MENNIFSITIMLFIYKNECSFAGFQIESLNLFFRRNNKIKYAK